MKIIIGSDHAGYRLKCALLDTVLKSEEVCDMGTHDESSVDYPDIAREVASRVSKGEFERGILLCGTGLGMAMTANKVEGIRAANCYNSYIAKMSRRHNNSNLLCLGGRTIGKELAKEITKVWLKEEFEEGRHRRRVEKMMG